MVFYPESRGNHPSDDKPEADSLGDKVVSGESKNGGSRDLSGGDSQQVQCALASAEPELGCGICDCPCCKDVHNAHQPKDLDKSKMLHVHASHERKEVHQSLTPGQFKPAGTLSTSGSVSVPPHSKSFVLSAAVQRVKGCSHNQSTRNPHLPMLGLAIGKKLCSALMSTKKAKCTRKLL